MLRSAWQTLQWMAARQPTLCSPPGTAVRSVSSIYSLFSSDNTSNTKYIRVMSGLWRGWKHSWWCQHNGYLLLFKGFLTNEMDNLQSYSSGKVCDSSGDWLFRQRVSGGGWDPGYCWGRGLSGEGAEARSGFFKLFLTECRRGPGSC